MSSKKLIREFFALCPDGICDVSALTESEKRDVRDNGAMYLTGIIQRADAKNGNGRKYPRRILEREIENYKKLVAENRALGECVDEDTQIMTHDGWKYLKDISDNEVVFVLDESGELREEEIKKKVVIPFKGNMLHFKNKSTLDMKLTPNHKVIAEDRKGRTYTIFAEELASKIDSGDSFISHSSIRKIGGEWNREKEEYFKISGKKVKSEDWAAFLGFYLAEGCAPEGHGNKIQITQKKEDTLNEFRILIRKLPFEHSERTRETGTVDFLIHNKDIREYLEPLGKSYEKYIPEDVKQWHPELLEVMLTWMLKGDGRNRKRALLEREKNPRLHRELYTTSQRLAEDVEQIFFKLGSSSNIQVRRQKDRYIEGRLVKEENSRELFIVSENSTRGISLDSRFVSVEAVPYEGNVYCVETSTGNWLMKREGHAIWTHNCDHPDDSVVNLRNASHLVTDVWWEGNDVWGKIKVLSTPSGNILKELVRSGVQLGISSRGLGSVREEMGNTIVEDDFQLICFDMVSEPSTQGAFMNLRESKNKPNIFTKADKMNRIMNDILGK